MSEIDDQALEWVAKTAAAPLCEVDQQAFDVWYAQSPRHQGAYLRAQAIWHSLGKATIQADLRPVTGSTGATRVAAGRQQRASRRAFLAAGLAAASVVVVVGGRTLLGPRAAPRTVLKTVIGEFRKVPLADHSIASLNSASRVEVSMTDSLRRVVLKEGEAWFEVAKNPDKPFVVEAGDVRVRAVGTAFSVRRRDNGADVLVTEGIVEVWSDRGRADARQVRAGEEAYIADAADIIKVSGSPEEVERKLAWREGNIILDNETLADAVVEFNRYNTQKITIADPALRQMRFVGQYRIDQPGQFAEAVQGLLNVPTSVGPDGIIIGAPKGISKDSAKDSSKYSSGDLGAGSATG